MCSGIGPILTMDEAKISRIDIWPDCMAIMDQISIMYM